MYYLNIFPNSPIRTIEMNNLIKEGKNALIHSLALAAISFFAYGITKSMASEFSDFFILSGCCFTILSLICATRIYKIFNEQLKAPPTVETIMKRIKTETRSFSNPNKLLKNSEIETIAKFLETNQTIDFMNLYDNDFDLIGLQCLTEALSHNSVLRGLDLGLNQISEEGASLLSDALMNNRSLTYLNLSSNFCRDKGSCHIEMHYA